MRIARDQARSHPRRGRHATAAAAGRRREGARRHPVGNAVRRPSGEGMGRRRRTRRGGQTSRGRGGLRPPTDRRARAAQQGPRPRREACPGAGASRRSSRRFARANARKFRGFEAWEKAIASVKNAVDLPFDEGMKREREMFMAAARHDPIEGAALCILRRTAGGQDRRHRPGCSAEVREERRRDWRGHDGRRHIDEFPLRWHPGNDRRDLEGSARPRCLDHSPQLREHREEGPPHDGRGRGAHGPPQADARFRRACGCGPGDRGGVRKHGHQEADFRAARPRRQAWRHPRLKHLVPRRR